MRNDLLKDMSELPAMITAQDLQRLGLSRPIAYQMMRKPDMHVVKIGRRFFIPKDKFLSWLDSNSISTAIAEEGQ